MQAFEFRATTLNGIIKIPDEYAKKLATEVRVVLYTEDKPEVHVLPKRPSLMNLAGALKGCPDMDVKEIRAERRKKYEDID